MPAALEQLSQMLSIPAAGIDPVSQAPGTVTTGGVDMSKFRRVLFIIDVGVFGAASTVDAKLQESATAGGVYTDVAGTSITQLVTAGGNNRIVTLEMRDDQMTKQFCRCSLTLGGAATLLCIIALGGEAEYKPASKNDIAAVAQRLVK